MFRLGFILLLSLIVTFTIGIFAQNSTSLETVKSFYKFDRSHSQILTRAAIESRRTWLSLKLYKLFQNELKRGKAYLKKNPTNKPYFGDGLSFQPIEENCGTGGRGLGKRLTVRAGNQDLRTAKIKAIFAFPKPCKDPDTTIYTLKLIRKKSGWLIDNVIYEDGSNLVSDLKRKDY